MGTNGYILRSVALLPMPLLAAAPLFGPGWAMATLFYLSFFTYFADEILVANQDTPPPQGQPANAYTDLVPVVLAIGHFLLLPLAILYLAKGQTSVLDKSVNFMAFSLYFGTVSTANAHELIHRRGQARRSLGKWVFISLLFGHHVSAHLSVHHPFVATNRDPNSASAGEGFYRFFLRAWFGSFRAGLAAEKNRQRMHGNSHFARNPYTIYLTGSAVFVMLAGVIGGPRAVVIYLGLAGFAQAQLLLGDYVQHYGLKRQKRQDGRYEAVSIFHSWNAPHAFSTALMLNASRHSDHHTHPSTPYSDLRSHASIGAPILPYSLPIMSIIALFPNQWRAIMAPHLHDWEQRHASA